MQKVWVTKDEFSVALATPWLHLLRMEKENEPDFQKEDDDSQSAKNKMFN